MTHICVGKLTIFGSDNGLSPGRRQSIIWTNDGILLIGALGTNFSEILIEIQTSSFGKNRLRVSSAKWRPFCLGLNELTRQHASHVRHALVTLSNQISVICVKCNAFSIILAYPGDIAGHWGSGYILACQLSGPGGRGNWSEDEPGGWNLGSPPGVRVGVGGRGRREERRRQRLAEWVKEWESDIYIDFGEYR